MGRCLSVSDWTFILEQYYFKHGHTCAKRNEFFCGVNLGNVVHRLRKLRRLDKLSASQIDQLDEIEFQWSRISQHLPFEAGLSKLNLYKAISGNTNIPFVYPADQHFATWAHNLRAQLMNKVRNKKSTIRAWPENTGWSNCYV